MGGSEARGRRRRASSLRLRPHGFGLADSAPSSLRLRPRGCGLAVLSLPALASGGVEGSTSRLGPRGVGLGVSLAASASQRQPRSVGPASDRHRGLAFAASASRHGKSKATDVNASVTIASGNIGGRDRRASRPRTTTWICVSVKIVSRVLRILAAGDSGDSELHVECHIRELLVWLRTNFEKHLFHLQLNI